MCELPLTPLVGKVRKHCAFLCVGCWWRDAYAFVRLPSAQRLHLPTDSVCAHGRILLEYFMGSCPGERGLLIMNDAFFGYVLSFLILLSLQPVSCTNGILDV